MKNITGSLKMGAFGKKSVLKLVHPGGFMEIHRRPVKASEVMRKNPRHCVTRPDVFKFPWIVVRPESILEPGNVFYIVPNHTIYRLLQASESSVERLNRKDSTRKIKVCATVNSTRTQPIYNPMDSNEPKVIQQPKGTEPKKLGQDRPRSTWAHLRLSPSKPPPLKPHQPQPSLKRSPLKSLNYNDRNRGERLFTGGEESSMDQHMYHEVSVAPNNKHHKNYKVKLKPCLIKEGQKRSKPDGLKVRFDLPDDEDMGKTGVVAQYWC